MRTHTVGPSQERNHWWMVRVWIIVVLFAMVTAAGSYHIGIPVRDPHGMWFRSRFLVSLGLFAVFTLVDASARAGLRQWTVGRTLDVLRRRWTRLRLAVAMSGLLAYHIVYLCYHNLKSWDVFHQPRDAMLQEWDRWLFLGHSPAVLLHDILGQHFPAVVLTAVYMSFSTVVSCSVVAALVFPGRVRQGYVLVTAAIWAWILGVGSYYLIPSLGPFSFAPHDFAGLPHTMIQDLQARYLAQRADLLAQPQAPGATAQIAAFASLHVAFVCLLLLMARHYRLRRATQAMTVYLAGTVLATVYLGWHYAVDVFAGLAIACVAMFLGRWTICPRLGRRLLRAERTRDGQPPGSGSPVDEHPQPGEGGRVVPRYVPIDDPARKTQPGR